MTINKQKAVQLYFSLRHVIFELRKIYIKSLYSSESISDSLNNNHKRLLKQINDLGWGRIPHNKLLDNKDKLIPLITRANELIQNQDEMLILARKINSTKKNFKVTITELFNRDQIINIISDSNMLRIIQEYFGTEPYFCQSDIWWDRNMGDEARDSQTYHYDGEDPIMIKVFFYLTNVNNNDGPFTFIGKSNKFFKKLSLIYHHGIHGVPDSDIPSHLVSNIKKFIGKSGDIIFADVNGYHKGTVVSPKSQGRILLTLTFVSKWPVTSIPKNQLIPFISATELIKGKVKK